MDIKEWLSTPCKPEEVATLDDGAEYIPIGILETILDEAWSWNTDNFRFDIIKTGNYWFATGSVLLSVEWRNNNGNIMVRKMQGGCTMAIGSGDVNMDYEATVLSFCIANAAKKLGKRFGRHLNGRLEKGETAIKLDKNAATQKQQYEDVESQFNKLKADIEAAPTKEDAKAILEASSFRNTIAAKNLVNNKN